MLDGVGGGGRYDGLVAALGGPDVSGVGFGAGIERILLACDADGVLSAADLELSRALDAFVVDASDEAVALELSHELREAGLPSTGRSTPVHEGADEGQPERSGARVACIVGKDDLAAGVVTVAGLHGPDAHRQEKVQRANLRPVSERSRGSP